MEPEPPWGGTHVVEERNNTNSSARGRGEPVHAVTLTNREDLQVSGVLHVDSFDDRQIVLATDLGTLTIQGQDLQIRQLDLESGRFAVEGVVNALNYSVGNQRERKGQGFLERLLR